MSELETNMEIIVYNKKKNTFREDVVTFASGNHPGKGLVTLRSTGILKKGLLCYPNNAKTNTWLLLKQQKVLEKVE